MRFLFSIVAGCALAVSALGADAYLIRNAVVHTLADGDAPQQTDVLLQDGKIAGVGQKLRAPRGAEVIDARGLHLYPGVFDAFSTLGLTEIASVSATNDTAEKGDFNPHLRALTAVHPESDHIAVTRSEGITHALTAMDGGVMTGQAAVISLDGWTYEEMAVEADGPLVLVWPRLRVYSDDRPRRGRAPEEARPTTYVAAKKKYDEQVTEIEGWLESARHYAQAKQAGLSPEQEDSRLEALLPVVAGERLVIVVADEARSIRQSVEFARKHKLKIAISGGAEAAQVKDLLAERDIAVILGPTQALPGEEDDPYDRLFAQPKELLDQGVRFAFSSGSSATSRTLPHEAAEAVPYGLPKDEAIKSITRYPAEILGLGDRLGTIEEGKIANLILTDGDPLEITTQVQRLFINGREVSTDNRQRQLYEKYRERP